jgi:transposase
MLTAERNCLQSADSTVHGRLKIHFRWFARELSDIDADLNQHYQGEPTVASERRHSEECPWYRPRRLDHIVIKTVVIGLLNRNQIAALARVAPLNRDSGTLAGRRTLSGAVDLRRVVLYMAALVACRCNPVNRDFYLRLCSAVESKSLLSLPVCGSCF